MRCSVQAYSWYSVGVWLQLFFFIARINWSS